MDDPYYYEDFSQTCIVQLSLGFAMKIFSVTQYIYYEIFTLCGIYCEDLWHLL